ncbi:MAG: glycosyltransferase family 4 protein [Nitrososphaerota archaeon]|nr:glycosyltransferase family 4 protein [Nitrososphaerota archaeon]
MPARLRVKPKIVFLVHANLYSGAGIERFLLNILRNAPRERFEISVIQGDYFDRKRVSQATVESALKGVQSRIIKTFGLGFEKLASNQSLPMYALMQVPEALSYSACRLSNQSTLNELVSADLIYLTKNDDVWLVPRTAKSLIMGSTHTTKLRFQGNRLRRLLSYLMTAWFTFRYRRIDGFHFHTKQVADHAVVRKNYDIIGLEYGADTRLLFPTLEANSGPVRFLFAGRLEPTKGIGLLLDAWDLMRPSRAELHIVGSGSLESMVQKRAGKANATFHGQLTDEELYRLYRSCDVFVFPSEAEIYPLVVLEALASGLYVICSDILRGCFDEFEKMQMLEYVPLNASEFCDKMSKAAESRDNLQRGKIPVHDYIKTNLDWSTVTFRLFSEFERVIAAHARNQD